MCVVVAAPTKLGKDFNTDDDDKCRWEEEDEDFNTDDDDKGRWEEEDDFLLILMWLCISCCECQKLG